MKQQAKIIIFIYFVFASSYLSAQTENKEAQKLKSMPVSCVKDVKIDSSQTIRFEFRAIKYKKDWILVASDNSSNYVMRLQPETIQLIAASDFFKIGILKVIESSNFKLKQKKEEVDDLVLYRYFKPKGKAKEQIEVLLELEEPAGEAKGLAKVFGFLKK